MDEQPLVSVYIPTKNRPGLLHRAIKSVIYQTYQNLEIIIVDDNSASDAKFYIENIKDLDQRIILIRNDTSLGACAARNQAIRASRGKFVTGLDDDDIFHPKRIELMIKAYDPKWSCLSTNYYVIKKNGKILENSLIGRIVNRHDLFTSNCLGSQVLVEKSRVLHLGGFDESLKASQDLDLWIRLVDVFGPAKRLRQCLYFLDKSHDQPRISSSANRILGTKQFMKKYKFQMTKNQYRYKLFVASKKENKINWLAKVKYSFCFGYSVFVLKVRNQLRLG